MFRIVFHNLGLKVRAPCSLFWHQNNRQMVSQLTDFLLHRIMHLSRRTWLMRFVNLSLNFFISGLLHVVVDMASGLSWHESGALQFFCTQVIGIALEEGVQMIYHRFSVRADHLGQSSSAAFQSTVLVGYIWVVMFLTWSFPIWIYPTLNRMRGGPADSMLPFSILTRFIKDD